MAQKKKEQTSPPCPPETARELVADLQQQVPPWTEIAPEEIENLVKAGELLANKAESYYLGLLRGRGADEPQAAAAAVGAATAGSTVGTVVGQIVGKKLGAEIVLPLELVTPSVAVTPQAKVTKAGAAHEPEQ